MFRKANNYLVLFSVMALVCLIASIASAATVTNSITYQGKLTNAAGSPLTGTYPVTFGLFDQATGGRSLSTDTHSVTATNGLFTTSIAVMDLAIVDGRALWLGIKVGSDPEMTPRQEIRPVPYALSLRPGAMIVGSGTTPVLKLTNSGQGSPAIDAWTSGDYSNGVNVTTSGFGGKGINVVTNGQQGTAIHAIANGIQSNAVVGETSADGPAAVAGLTTGKGSYGLYGKTTGLSSPGLYTITSGTSSAGVYTITSGDNSNGVHATVSGINSKGIDVLTTNSESMGVNVNTRGVGSHGVDAFTSALGSYGVNVSTSGLYSAGVHATTTGDNAAGIYIITTGGNSIGVRAHTSGEGSNGVLGSAQGNNSSGVFGFSQKASGIYAMTNRPDNKYGVQTPDYIRALGYETGYSDIAEYMPVTGDVMPGTVLVIGADSKLEPSTTAYDTSVAGIVSSAPGVSLGAKEGGNPGEQIIAISGRVPCKVDASNGPIHPKDLLTTSDNPGYAMKAVPVNIGGVEIYRPGTTLGKAMGTLESGTGTIEVLVTLQ